MVTRTVLDLDQGNEQVAIGPCTGASQAENASSILVTRSTPGQGLRGRPARAGRLTAGAALVPDSCQIDPEPAPVRHRADRLSRRRSIRLLPLASCIEEAAEVFVGREPAVTHKRDDLGTIADVRDEQMEGAERARRAVSESSAVTGDINRNGPTCG
jgi:hypothetical protein